VVGASGSPAAGSASPHERIASPDATRGSQRSRCCGEPKRAIGSAAPTSVGIAGTGATRARTPRQHGELGEALPHPALLRGHGDAEQVRARERAPELVVEVQLAALDLAQAVGRRLLLEDLARELAQLALHFGGMKVHD
jgi:hypothetical protein